jgi:N-acetylglucosaminyl-diphospho-decaprenol L-rhamnosyltransferase
VTAHNWTIITVSYNSSADLKKCWSEEVPKPYRWIVADNASTDDSAAVARSLGAEVIALDQNLGFARANNAALAQTQTPYVAFVNPDVSVKSQDLQRLADISRLHGAVVAPQLVNPDGTLQPNGRGLPFLLDKFAHRGLSLPGSNAEAYIPSTSTQPTYVAWVMGAAVCGATEYFKQAGGWDERFFLYYEDHAMGLDAWRNDVPVIVDPNCKWVHGWRRETHGARVMPWVREIASAARFYRKHPLLLLPLRRPAHRRYTRIVRLSGQTVGSFE